MSDFSDRPFVAGSLIGLRAFAVDKYGRLTGPSFGGVFKPGENEAECRKDSSQGPWGIRSYAALMSTMYTLPMPSPYSFSFSVEPPPQKTTYGKGDCPCGCGIEVEFHDGDTEADERSLSTAAVKPAPTPKPVHTLAGVTCTCGFYAYFDGLNDYKDPERIAAVVEGYGVCTVGDRGFRAAKAKLVALVEPKAKVSPLMRERLHRNYDGVPFYASKREALDAHPPTPPPVPGPDAEDFWTRPAS